MSNPSESQSSPKRKEVLYMDAHYKDPWLPPPPIHTYHVPSRFGVSGLIAITSVMAVAYGVLRFSAAPAWLYAYITLLVSVISFAQMRFESLPRIASCVAGTMVYFVYELGYAMFESIRRGGTILSVGNLNMTTDEIFLFKVCCTAIFGYLIGGAIAGSFLIVDYMDICFFRSTTPAKAVQWDGPESEQRLEKSYEPGIEISGEADHPAAKHSGI